MFSFVGDTVLDPFTGTGTTQLAAMHEGRNSYGYEVEPGYESLIRNRLLGVVPLASVTIVSPFSGEIGQASISERWA